MPLEEPLFIRFCGLKVALRAQLVAIYIVIALLARVKPT